MGGLKTIHTVGAVIGELCTVMNGTLAFDISESRDPSDCIDICPDTIYQDSVKSECGVSLYSFYIS